MSFRSLAFSFHLGQCSVITIVQEVCLAIWKHLLVHHMPSPTKQNLREIESDFLKKWSFPNCIGCIETLEFSPVILHMIIDANYKFIAIDVGDYDNQLGDAKSILSLASYNDFLDRIIKTASNITNASTNNKVFVGSDAYPLKFHLLRPYSKRTFRNDEMLLNQKIGEVRECVDHTLGLLGNKWKWLLRAADIKSIDKSIIMMRCVCLLHNIVIDCEGIDASTLTKDSSAFKSLAHIRIKRSRAFNNYPYAAQNMRNTFQKHFLAFQTTNK